jgi:hypothetical protein
VPFGDSVFVRNFLHVTGKVQSPESMHPKRPILGLTCPRREVFHYPFSSLPSLVINDRVDAHKAMASNVLHVI